MVSCKRGLSSPNKTQSHILYLTIKTNFILIPISVIATENYSCCTAVGFRTIEKYLDKKFLRIREVAYYCYQSWKNSQTSEESFQMSGWTVTTRKLQRDLQATQNSHCWVPYIHDVILQAVNQAQQRLNNRHQQNTIDASNFICHHTTQRSLEETLHPSLNKHSEVSDQIFYHFVLYVLYSYSKTTNILSHF